MLIVCPSCGIKYNVPESYLKKDRTLKCASCGTSWVVPAIRETDVPTDEQPSRAQIPASEPPKAEPVAEKTQEPVTPAAEQTSAVAAPVAESPLPEVSKPEPEPAGAEAARTPEPPIQEPPKEPPPAPVQEPPPAEPLPEPLSEKPESVESFAEAPAPHPVFEEAPETEAVPQEIHAAEVATAPDERHEDHAVHGEKESVFSFLDEEAEGRKEDHAAASNEPPQSHAHEETEKPFSFLDSSDDRVVHRGRADEEKPPTDDEEDSGGFIDWDAHEKKTAHAQPETPAAPSHEWDEKDLDSHFDDANWHANTGMSESLAEEPATLDRFETGVHDEVPWARPDASQSDGEETHAAPETAHQPADGQFDDVINRIRASRRSAAAGLEPAAPEAPPQPEASVDHQPASTPDSNEPWVPAWERAAQTQPAEEMPPQPQVEAHGEAPIWDLHPAATEQQEAAEEEHAPVEKETVASPEAEERHVTAAADISSRLRNDVLNRVASKDSLKPGSSGSLLESPAFWRKAWIASGVGAAVGLAACVHWFSALRHLWPALNLL